MSIQDQVTALVRQFNGAGDVNAVIDAAKRARTPLKDTVRDWHLSVDKSLSKRKATELAKGAITLWWEARGKSETAGRMSEISSTHAYSHEKHSANGNISVVFKPLPQTVIRSQSDLARAVLTNQKLEGINEQLRKELAELRAIVSGGKVINAEEAPAATEAAPQ